MKDKTVEKAGEAQALARVREAPAVRLARALSGDDVERRRLVREWSTRGGLEGWDGLMVLGERARADEIICRDTRVWWEFWERIEDPYRKVAWLKVGRAARVEGWDQAGRASLKRGKKVVRWGVFWRLYYGFRVRWMVGSSVEDDDIYKLGG